MYTHGHPTHATGGVWDCGQAAEIAVTRCLQACSEVRRRCGTGSGLTRRQGQCSPGKICVLQSRRTSMCRPKRSWTDLSRLAAFAVVAALATLTAPAAHAAGLL